MSRSLRPAMAVMPLCTAVCTAVAQSAPPAPTSDELPAVVVSGKRHPDASTLTQPDLPTARERLQRTAGGVGVVDAATYTEGRVSTLSDALGAATGVYVQPRFGAEESRVSIRGSGLQRTFHGRGLKLMQDGVPLNLADGSFDFQAVEALSARYVEIWRGANALQYGAATLGGAINFVSPNGYNGDRTRVRLEAGSRGYARAQLSTADVIGAFDYYVSTSAFVQDGYRRHADQDTRRNFANLGYRFSDQLETRVYLGHVDSDSELPGSLTWAQLQADPRQANPANVTGDQKRDVHWTRLSSKTVYRDGAHQFELFAFASDKSLFHPIFQVLDQDNRDRGVELRYAFDAPLAGRRNRLVLGIAHSQGRTAEDRFVNVAGDRGARTNQSRQTARNLELHAENQHHVLPDLALVTGLQATRSTRRLDDRFVAGTPADPVSERFEQRYDAISPKLGLRWDSSPQVQWFANVSRSFEPPSFGELAGGLRPTLNDAQRAVSFELGTRGRTSTVEWDVVFYNARLRDELLQVATNTAGASVTVNAARTLHRGIELGLAGKALASAAGRVEWRLNGLWNDFRFRKDPTYGNRQLPGLPRHMVRAQAGYRLAGGTLLALQLEHSGGYAIDFAQTQRAPAYTIWGLKAAGPVSQGVSWFVEGRNLSDRRHAVATGVLRDAQGRDQAQYLPGDGRSVYAGIDWRFN